MIWRGKHLRTLADFREALGEIATDAEAGEFMGEFRRENPFADAVIGHLSRTLGDAEERDRLLARFGVDPARGCLGAWPPPPVAWEAGRTALLKEGVVAEVMERFCASMRPSDPTFEIADAFEEIRRAVSEAFRGLDSRDPIAVERARDWAVRGGSVFLQLAVHLSLELHDPGTFGRR